MRKLSDLQPMNSNERFLYELIIRQNIIIEQLSSIIEHIGKKDGVAVQSTEDITIDVAVEEKAPVKRARKRKVEE